MLEANKFWEEFTDHSVIALSFFFLGTLFGSWMLYKAINRRAKIDYEMDRGDIMRIPHDGSGKTWFVIRPSSFMQVLDILFLCVIDRGKEKYVDKHDRVRVRIITIVCMSLVFLFALSGFLLVLSAFGWSMNPFDYLHRLQRLS